MQNMSTNETDTKLTVYRVSIIILISVIVLLAKSYYNVKALNNDYKC